MDGVIKVFEYIFLLLKANIMFILLVLLGLVGFGIFPATYALSVVTRDWANKNFDGSVCRRMFKIYKDSFIVMNKYFLIYGSVIVILAINLYIALQVKNIFFLTISFLVLFFLAISVLAMLYLFTVVANFNNDFKGHIKMSLILTIYKIKYSCFIILALFVFYIIFVNVPGLVVYVLIAGLSYVISLITKKYFIEIENKITVGAINNEEI